MNHDTIPCIEITRTLSKKIVAMDFIQRFRNLKLFYSPKKIFSASPMRSGLPISNHRALSLYTTIL